MLASACRASYYIGGGPPVRAGLREPARGPRSGPPFHLNRSVHNRLAEPETPIDAAARRLSAAGWNIGDGASRGPWIVSGTNGENHVHAVADSQAAAWQLALEQAAAVGMLGA